MPHQTFVLVAEDEELVRLVIVQALLDEGFEVLEAEHAEAALIVLESHARRIGDFQRGVSVLKQTPAPDAETAKRRSEQGLRIMVTAARLQLFAAIRTALARVDEPVTLAALENACGGKVRQLEASSG